MDKKLISVVVPVYNGEKTLQLCIESIEKQTYKNIEIIIVDDGSCDNSLTVANGLAAKYGNIRVEKIEHRGVSAARNAGIDKANGEYITFMDCDDTVQAQMLEIMARELDIGDVQLAVVGIERIEDGVSSFERYDEREVVYIENAARLYLKSMYFNSCSNKLYISSVINDNNIRFAVGVRIGEDFLFNAEYAGFVEKTAVVSKPMYIYEMSGATQKTFSDTSRFDIIGRMYDAIIPFAKNDTELEKCINRRICEEYLFAMRLYCMSDTPLRQKVKSVDRVMKSRQYTAVEGSSRVGGKYGFVLKMKSAFFVCLYFTLGKLRHKSDN